MRYIDGEWRDNAFTVKSDLMHDRVHGGKTLSSNANKWSLSAVKVYNDEPQLNIYGVTDCLELVRNKAGVFIPKYACNCELTVVEYKPTMPKSQTFSQPDALQVFAQKLCVDYVFNTSCKAVIYYADTKKRVPLPFDAEYDAYYKTTVDMLAQMREFMAQDKIPPIEKSQNCNGCSMADYCLPKHKGSKTVRRLVREEMEAAL